MDQTFERFETLDENIELLVVKGYLDGNFKTSVQAGYWLREFQEQYDQCRASAVIAQQSGEFTIATYGQFEHGLQPVSFYFRYKFEPAEEKLTLLALYARFGKFKKSYRLRTPADLPLAADVHQTLSKADALNGNLGTYIGLYFQFQRDKNPDNDFDPENTQTRYHPDRLSVDYRRDNGEKQRIRPKLGLPPSKSPNKKIKR